MYYMSFQALINQTETKFSLFQSFKRAIVRKSESLLSEGLLTLGKYISWALDHWMGISYLLEQAWKILKKKFAILEHFL